jgi:hypothetical protein
MKNNKKLQNKKINLVTLFFAVTASLVLGWLGAAFIGQDTPTEGDNFSSSIKDTQEVSESATTAVAQTENQTYYTQAASNVRSCGSTSCAVLGTYQPNRVLSLPFDTVQDMPEWVSLQFTDEGGITKNGYISKVLLSESKVVIQQPSVHSAQQIPVTSSPSTLQNSDKSSFYASLNNVFIIHNSGVSYIMSAMENIAEGNSVRAEFDLESAVGVVGLAENEYINTVRDKYNNLPPDFNTAGVCMGARIGYSYKLIDELSRLTLSDDSFQSIQIYVENMDFSESCIQDFLNENI